MRRWVGVAGVACLALSACGGGTDEVDRESSPPSSVVDEEGEPTSTPTTEDASLWCLAKDPPGWTSSDALAGRIDGARLAANSEVVVALGPPPDGDTAVVYHSSDGLAWERGTGLPDLRYGGPEIAVAGGAAGFVVAGVDDTHDSRDGLVSTPVVAFSADGSHWERIDPRSLPASRVRWLSNVFAGPDGFMIVGTGTGTRMGDLPIFLWFSADGRTWSTADLPVPPNEAVAVTATESGWAALSLHMPEPGPAEARTPDDMAQCPAPGRLDSPSVRVWTTSDGARWAEVDTVTGPPGLALLTYTGTAPFVVRGETWVVALAGANDDSPGPREPTVWVSTDAGTTWVERPVWNDPDDADRPGFQVFDLAFTDHGLVLAGYQDRPADRGVHFVHRSDDGTAWEHCWTDPHELTSIAVTGDSVVVVDSGRGLVFVWDEP